MAVDWTVSEQELYQASVNAIERFAREHSTKQVCFFASDSEPRYGCVLISFDTLENNIRSAKALEQRAIASRQRNLNGKLAWQWAKYQLRTPILAAFNTNSGDFAFQQYTRVEFPAWRELAEEGGYPVGSKHEDDYLESSARLVLWGVAERLVREQAFLALNLASPFMVGYGIHDQETVILRLINWSARG